MDDHARRLVDGHQRVVFVQDVERDGFSGSAFAQSRLRERAAAEPVPLDVLYEDDALMAINKPAGMVVHPSYRNSSGTLLNGVLWRTRDRKDVRPGLVSRLDKDTSGVVVVALSPGVHARVQRDARAAQVI